MKKTIAILIAGLGLALHADYLYWMVDTDSAKAYTTYTTVKLTDGNGFSQTYTGISNSDIETYKNGGGYFTAEGTFTDSQSFFVELYNGTTWVAESQKIPYSTLFANGSIFKSGSIAPATITPATFGSYNVPEPTSGMLFLIGGVLLGLRRRRQV